MKIGLLYLILGGEEAQSSLEEFKTQFFREGFIDYKTGKEISLENISNEYFSDMINGKIDEIIGLKSGSTKKIITLSDNLSARERIFIEYLNAEIDIEKEQIVNLQKGIKSEPDKSKLKYLEKKIRETYSVGPGELENILTLQGAIDRYIDESPDDYANKVDCGERVGYAYYLDSVYDYIKKNKISLIEDKEAHEILEKYGLGDIAQRFYLHWAENSTKTTETQKPSYAHLKPNPNNEGDNNFLKYATKAHNALVEKLVTSPDLIEEGFIPMKAEYGYEIDEDTGKPWAKVDIYGFDSKGNILAVEVKQNAIRNGNGFDNGAKAVEQTTGYRAAMRARLAQQRNRMKYDGCLKDYSHRCGLYDYLQSQGIDMDIPVRGMLVAYTIDEATKSTIKEEGCEYKEIPEVKEQGEKIK